MRSDSESFIMIGLVVMVITLSIGFGRTVITESKLGDNPEITESVEEEVIFEITSLETNNTQQGRFFLGTGSIEETSKYAVMAKMRDGYILKTLNAETTIVVETDDKTPKYVRETITKTEKNKETQYESTYVSDVVYKLYIPTNSIDRNYSTKIGND